MAIKVEIKIVSDGKTYVGTLDLSPVGSQKLLLAPGQVPAPGKIVATKPSEAINNLYQHGFFSTGRRLGDVVDELLKAGYNFSRPSVFMFLKSASFLHIRGKRGSYTFVQKYPSGA
jgi:hypothetical protein